MDAALEERVLATFERLKEGPSTLEPWLPLMQQGRVAGWLEPVTWHDADRSDALRMLMDWRRTAAPAFLVQSPLSMASTQRWMIRELLNLPRRILFWVTTAQGERIGHVGLYHFHFADRRVELDNVVRGVSDVFPGGMGLALRALIDWVFERLEMTQMGLRVFADNTRAVQLYERLGFREQGRVVMTAERHGEVVRWVERTAGTIANLHDRQLLRLTLARAQWRQTVPVRDVAA